MTADPTHPSYINYGARGITYIKRWEKFCGFWEDMGGSYRPGLTLERIDVNKGYTRRNCRWATKGEQNRNKRNTIHIWLDGEKLHLEEACRRIGIEGSQRVWSRIRRTGESVQEGFSHFKKRQEEKAKGLHSVIFEGRTTTIEEAARAIGLKNSKPIHKLAKNLLIPKQEALDLMTRRQKLSQTTPPVTP